jgi:hypothetical protein
MLEIEQGCWFQQDGAAEHTVNSAMETLQELFGNNNISQNVWPPRSPDLSIPDFYLWGVLKDLSN